MSAKAPTRPLTSNELLVFGVVQDVYGAHLTMRDVALLESANGDLEAGVFLPNAMINLSHWAERRTKEDLRISVIERGISLP
jgi:hypothetical protein